MSPTDVICRTIGCSSIFAKWFQWPHRIVCYHVTMPGEVRGEMRLRRANQLEAFAMEHTWATRPSRAFAMHLRRRGGRLLRKHYGL